MRTSRKILCIFLEYMRKVYVFTHSHFFTHSKTLRVFLVGVPGIEPGSHGPKPRILPLYYTPLYVVYF